MVQIPLKVHIRCILISCLLFLWAGCEPTTDTGSTTAPQTAMQLPDNLNIRDNILELRGITPDFTQDSWAGADLQRVHSWQEGNGYFLLGSLATDQSEVQSFLILEDGPAESNAWIVNYHKDQLADFLLVFHQNNLQNRTVGSDWVSGQLTVRLKQGADYFRETFTISPEGTFQPLPDNGQ